MRDLALLAILTVSALALAGCSGDGDGDGDATSSSSSSSRSSSSGASTSSSASASSTSASSTSTGPANSPPTGSISVTVNGTTATFSLTGSDPDGDIVVWDLAFGDGSSANGTQLPAAVNHTYAAAGNFTANYTVTDGQSPVTYDLQVDASGAIGGAAGFSATGSYSAGGPGQGCSPIGALFTTGEDDGITHSELEITEAEGGKTYTITIVPAAPTMGITVSYVSGSSINGGETNVPTPDATSLSGTVPDGTELLIISSCGGAEVEWTIAIP